MAGTAGSGGRNAKSPEEHRRLGTYQNVRHSGYETPEPPSGVPPVPASLDGVALQEWNRMVARLQKSNTLAVVDDAALYQYCLLYAEAEQVRVDAEINRKLAAKLHKSTAKLTGNDLVQAIDRIVDLQHLVAGAIKTLRGHRMALRQWLVEFGQTPGSRTRVKIMKDAKPKSKLLAFRGGKSDDPAPEIQHDESPAPAPAADGPTAPGTDEQAGS